MTMTTILDGLLADETRRFSWAEMKFFQMWYKDLTKKRK